MEELKESYTIDEYNDEPVFYCKHCLSLRVRVVGGFNFCDECGSTAIETAHINDWENMYVERNGHKFLEEEETDYYKFLK